MKLILLNVLLLLAVHFSVQAQLTFERTYGGIDDDKAYQARPAANNRYIVTGETTNYLYSDPEIYVLCIDQNGDTVWTRTMPNPMSYDLGCAVIPALDGTYVIAADIVSTHASTAFFQFSPSGDSIWAQLYNNSPNDDYASSAVQSPDAGFVMCGYSYSVKKDPLWGTQMFIQKTDASGSFLWRKNYPSTGVDYGLGIENAPDGGFILCGLKDQPGEDEDAWLMKTNATGEKQWEKFYGNPDALENANCVHSVPSGGYIMCGSWFDGIVAMNGDVYVVKTDGNGNLEWSKKYGGSGNEYGVSIDYTNDGGYIILGESNSFGHGSGDYDLYVIRVNHAGDTLWTKTFGGPFKEGAGSIFHTDDGGFLICGYTHSFGSGGADVYLIKTDENGVVTSAPGTGLRAHALPASPNPTSGMVTFTSPVQSTGYRITDIRGTIVAQGKGSQPYIPVTINLSECHDGVYVVQVYTKTAILSKKIIKIK